VDLYRPAQARTAGDRRFDQDADRADGAGEPDLRAEGPGWRGFLTTRAHAIIACALPIVETTLLKRLNVLVFIEPGTRRLHLGGVTAHPTGPWAVQQARNLAMELGDRLDPLRFLIQDRDPLFPAAFATDFAKPGTAQSPTGRASCAGPAPIVLPPAHGARDWSWERATGPTRGGPIFGCVRNP
jgi:hypothetical protein